MGLFRKKSIHEEIPSELPKLSSSINRTSGVGKIKSEEMSVTNNSGDSGPRNLNPDSFFFDLLKNIVRETSEIGRIEEWYKQEFLPTDLLNNMKNYWENKKIKLLLSGAGVELKNKILSRIKKLQRLEKEWKEAYVTLLAKEEALKGEEVELKKILGEFSELCKKHIGKE
jgi:hypothetical protein